MDQCTHEVRLQHWKEIISQCQARPAGQTAKQWLEENGICEQSYYSWQRRIRQETYEQMKQEDRLPAPAKKKEVSFAEISLKHTETASADPRSGEQPIHPVAVIKADRFSIAISNDIPESLLARILQEVAHA